MSISVVEILDELLSSISQFQWYMSQTVQGVEDVRFESASLLADIIIEECDSGVYHQVNESNSTRCWNNICMFAHACFMDISLRFSLLDTTGHHLPTMMPSRFFSKHSKDHRRQHTGTVAFYSRC